MGPVLAPKVALLFPGLELAVGLGLLIPATRRFAVPVVILMHCSLFVMLGPWGLGHSTGVLVWNLALIAQVYFLIFAQVADEYEGQSPSVFAPLTYGVLVIALVAPLTERSGYWDHWTSWALYSPHNSRVEIELHESAIAKLPASLQSFVDEDADGDRWHEFEIGPCSLTIRRVPVYPQARYQLAFAQALATRYELDEAIRLRQRSQSDRWTGNREEHQFLGQAEIEKALDQFWLTHQ